MAQVHTIFQPIVFQPNTYIECSNFNRKVDKRDRLSPNYDLVSYLVLSDFKVTDPLHVTISKIGR